MKRALLLSTLLASSFLSSSVFAGNDVADAALKRASALKRYSLDKTELRSRVEKGYAVWAPRWLSTEQNHKHKYWAECARVEKYARAAFLMLENTSAGKPVRAKTTRKIQRLREKVMKHSTISKAQLEMLQKTTLPEFAAAFFDVLELRLSSGLGVQAGHGTKAQKASEFNAIVEGILAKVSVPTVVSTTDNTTTVGATTTADDHTTTARSQSEDSLPSAEAGAEAGPTKIEILP